MSISIGNLENNLKRKTNEIYPTESKRNNGNAQGKKYLWSNNCHLQHNRLTERQKPRK